MLNALQIQEVHHASRLAVLAMAARGVAAAEFEDAPNLESIVITVFKGEGRGQLHIDVDFRAANGMAVAGVSL